MKIEQVWNEYRRGLHAFLRSRVSDPDDIEDLLQVILIKANDHLPTLTTDSSIKPWLYQVARNAATDFYRKQAKARAITADQLWYQQDSPELQQSLVPCVEPFIKALPEDLSTLLVAIDLEGRSQKDVAAEMGVSYSTLKSRVQKGRAELRALFDACCQFHRDTQGNVLDFDVRSDSCKKC